MLDEYTRGFLIREIKRAQRPAGMSVHDGRVHIDASVIQRLLAMIEKLSAERNALREALVIAREYVADEIAYLRNAFRGHEELGKVPEAEADLARIDAVLGDAFIFDGGEGRVMPCRGL